MSDKISCIGGTTASQEWIQVSCGGLHTAALTKQGEVFTCTGYGQTKKVADLNGKRIVKISCGAKHMAVVSDMGELFTWYVCEKNRISYFLVSASFDNSSIINRGDNKEGQLGHSTSGSTNVPVKVESMTTDEFITDVVCGFSHTCAVSSSGRFYTWGGEHCNRTWRGNCPYPKGCSRTERKEGCQSQCRISHGLRRGRR